LPWWAGAVGSGLFLAGCAVAGWLAGVP